MLSTLSCVDYINEVNGSHGPEDALSLGCTQTSIDGMPCVCVRERERERERERKRESIYTWNLLGLRVIALLSAPMPGSSFSLVVYKSSRLQIKKNTGF